MWSPLSLLKLLLIIFGCRSVCYAQDIGETELMTTHACQRRVLSIDCQNDQHVINVIYANYGRTDDQFCPGQNFMKVTDCILESSLEIVKQICQGRNNCSILATQRNFPNDPCPDVRKYLEVNYTCGMQDGSTISCSSVNFCNETAEVCVDTSTGVVCECAPNYQRGNDGSCQAVTCQNSPRFCNPTTERCQDHGTGIECVCADGYVMNRNNECIAITCQSSANTCDPVTERCQNSSTGIQCVCAEDYTRDTTTNECVAKTCQSSPGSCHAVTQRCEDLNPGIQCVCAEGYSLDSNNECTEMKVNDSSTTETPMHVTRCPAHVISVGGITLSFPSAETGEEVDSNQTCSQQLSKNQRQPLATRVCIQGVWQEPIVENCFDVDTLEEQLDVLLQLNITDVTVDQIANSLSLLTYQNDNISTDILDVIVESLDRIVEVGSSSFQVTDAIVGIVSSIMQINETVLDESEEVASVIPMLEKQITNVQKNEQNYSQILPNLNISAIKLPKSAFEGGFKFIDHSININGDRNNESIQKPPITLPYSVIEAVNKVHPTVTTVPVSFVTYQDSRLFRGNDDESSDNRNVTNEYIASYVISSTVELPNVTISGLPQNSSVIVNFADVMLYKRGNDAETEVLCVYWEYTSEDGEGEWSQTGCRKLSSGLKEVTCSCDHLTSFAVLVRTYDEEETSFHLVLQLTTIIGCIISIIGLFLSLLCMIVIRKVRSKQQTHVHFNLCFALLGLYLSFLFGVGQADHPETCRRMTSVIYFFCLSSMTWMSVEAFYIYKLIWKCKQHNIKHLIPVGVLFAWGLPGIAAVVIYFLDNTHDYESQPDYCFLHPGPVLLYGFLLELLILFLYNSIVFVLVTYRISCRKIQVWNKDDRRQEMVIRLKSTFLFWLLLGISWIFGFIATFEQPTSIVFQIIFCVLLSLQGFFMFYMLIVQNPEMKKGILSIRSQSTSIQLGTRSSTAHSTKEQSRQDNSASLDHAYDDNHYV